MLAEVATRILNATYHIGQVHTYITLLEVFFAIIIIIIVIY